MPEVRVSTALSILIILGVRSSLSISNKELSGQNAAVEGEWVVIITFMPALSTNISLRVSISIFEK